jgi:type I restriction enzyme S subunit
MVTGVGTLGVSYMVKEADRFYFKDGNIIWMSSFDSRVRSEFVHYLFSSDYIISQIKATAEGGTVGTYTITNAKATKVPLPSLEIQDAIISELRAEQEMVRNLREFQKGSQDRMNRVIESLWSR